MKTNLGRLRLLAFVEGVSFLLILCVTMPLKYWAGMHLPNQVVGLVHGLLFVVYSYYVLVVRAEYGWSWGTAFWAFIASFIPFGTFVADAKIFRKEVM